MIKPCNHCGAEPNEPSKRWYAYEHAADTDEVIRVAVVCHTCGAQGPASTTAEGANEAWNRRAPLTVEDAMSVKEVRDLVEWITEQIGEYAEHYHAVAIPECRPDERYHAAVRLLAPFLATMKAMKEEDHE
jgi:Lar family restriction alleviation protein